MKRTFKDFYKKDVQQIFFNSDELAETVVINGKSMSVVIDDDELERQKLKFGEKLDHAELLFHVSLLEFGNVPKPDVLLDFGKKRYRVLNTTKNAAVLTIALGRYSG